MQKPNAVIKKPIPHCNAGLANVTPSIVLYAVDNATRMENRRVGDAQRAHYSSVDIQLATNLNYGCIQRSSDFGCSSLFNQKITMHDTIHRKFCWFHYNYRASQNSLNICIAVFARNSKIVRLHTGNDVIMVDFHHSAHLLPVFLILPQERGAHKEVNNVNDNKKPSEPVEEERWALENVPTAQLVEELVSRDGVETYRIEPYQLKTLSAEGPAIVLIVTD